MTVAERGEFDIPVGIGLNDVEDWAASGTALCENRAGR